MDTSVFYGLDVQLLGCGRTNNVEYTWRVQTTEARVLHHSECGHRASQIEGVLLYVSVNYICSSRTPYAQLTNGDNGGPLLYNGAIVGINLGVSPPYHGTFHPNKVNIHLYLYLYRIFINHIIENDG
ncbi:PREDICTED: uncharacterized protein LOC105360114 [Ceratosolen solmsi marchali]|uniref:Uncharacterized protein LOC105360114 n=1 Tax=Ceratosolen solmsi marchali TaxID=326594 RepID=A0AAJ6VMB4_9HYME|nr:PREDICTED: uncharacterized protein LOC105360114 [Ceratosolen solmsi marchali]